MPVWFELARFAAHVNIKYCKKEGNYCEYGKPFFNGKGAFWQGLMRKVNSGAWTTLRGFLSDNPEAIPWANTIERLL